jgi:hypothetical protein
MDERARSSRRIPDVRAKVRELQGKRKTRRPPPDTTINLTVHDREQADLLKALRALTEPPAIRKRRIEFTADLRGAG